jgi:hypothetical protein
MHYSRATPQLLVVGLLGATSPIASSSDPVELVLPPAIHATPGVATGFFFDNLVADPTPGRFRFAVDCPIGQAEAKRWVVTPVPGNTGTHPLKLTVRDEEGSVVAEGSTTLVVAASDAGKGRQVRILFVGDSLTGVGGGYPSEVARLLSAPDNPSWRMLGSRQCPGVAGVRTEGYPGWKWGDFLTRYEAQPDPAKKKFTSPFVFKDGDAAPAVDVARYFRDLGDGGPPDVVVFLLGVNNLTPAYKASKGGLDREAMDRSIDATFQDAEALLAAVRRGAPRAALAVSLVPSSNQRDSAFENNYKGELRRDGCRRVQHRMARRMIEQFSVREKENVFLVPTGLWLDPEAGFPENNAVHPNLVGHAQLAATYYAWLKAWLTSAGNPASTVSTP